MRLGESQGEREPHRGERERGRSKREHVEEKVDSTVKEDRFQGGRGRASNEDFPRRSRRKHERVSGRKSSLGGFAESGQT